MTEQYKKLKATLETMFQLDQPDLDFGIYRIMNQKREEVTDFLNNRLLKQVKDTLSQAAGADRDKLKKELDQKENTLREMGVDPTSNDKWQELQAEYQTAASPEAMENEVYSHLTNFFRRYYHQGDFISQRRYKEGVYAIPYEGEEVKLHWANHDQYYIKTSEYFKNYRFELPNGKKINFELLEASTEQNNNKAQNNKERRFKLAEETVFEEVSSDVSLSAADEGSGVSKAGGSELKIFFTYEPTDKKQKQDDLMAAAFETLKKELPQAWLQELLRPKPTEKNKNRTLLEKHLKDYTARNTFDYFIHKDLGGFLRRELDFYIKNEILHIDDINLDNEQDFQKQLLLIKALKGVAQKIIDFLAQLEDFQKKLWLKKKFVLQSDYCLTLDRIDESFYADIAANQAQRQEWVQLFAIDELEDYSEPLSADFLKNNPYLVVDTQFFNRSWKYKLLGTLDRLDEHTDGLLVNSENFQALELMEDRYLQQVDCLYLDPPYNTAASEIVYKNSYKHSSWLSLISNRLERSLGLVKDDSISCMSIDDFELSKLFEILQNLYGSEHWLATTPIRSNPHGRAMAAGFSTNHEYAVYFGKGSGSIVGRLPRDSKKLARYPEKDEKGIFSWMNFRGTGANTRRIDRPKLYYPIFVVEDKLVVKNLTWSDEKSEWEVEAGLPPQAVELLPIDSAGEKRTWSLGWERAQEESKDNLEVRKVNDSWQVYRKYRPNQEGALPGTWWHDAKYSATESGTRIIGQLFGERNNFAYPKSIYLNEDILRASNAQSDAVVLDYFAGSGTTGHAVINLNREDDGKRKYILVEMGEYFNTVTKPRIQKVIYSEDWKNGKPVSRKGSSHCFKYLRLESYEDTLNNLQLQRTEPQAKLLSNENFEEEYRLHYMLEVESRESLLSVDTFKSPFGYTIKSIEHNEIKEVEVDLVETFNFLIGLVVDSIQVIKEYVVVIGDNLAGEHIAIIWRDVEKQDNQALNEFFRKTQINPRDTEFDRIYVNGDNNLENLKTAEDKWKVVLIEEEFHKRMFEEKSL